MTREYLQVVDVDEAHRRFREAVDLERATVETVAISIAAGRVVAEDVIAPLDVPGFDRSNVDGIAVRAADTYGADESNPVSLRLTGEVLSPGQPPTVEVEAGSATRIATGAMIPRGADAVVMIEDTRPGPGGQVSVIRAASPGTQLSFAGSDVSAGERVIPAGTLLTARETGTIAAIGLASVAVFARPRIGVLSTGNEIVPPGDPLSPGLIHDCNLRIVSDTIRELGCEPIELGVVRDDLGELRRRVAEGLALDGLILSGGTSKGEGDHTATVIGETCEVLCHGVAVRPGKPLLLAVHHGKPVAVLPGFPTSAVFTFHEFVAPILRSLARHPSSEARRLAARLPFRVETPRGRAEFLLVHLVEGQDGWIAYPMGKGSGSITTFARADGFIALPRAVEFVEPHEALSVRLLSDQLEPADLVVIGSHCLGLEMLLGRIRSRGFRVKNIVVGSQAGFAASERGECDVAGVHLCDENDVYNTPFVRGDVELVRGYGRSQGIISRESPPPPITARMVNRNRGSGTRVLIDRLLAGARPPGYGSETRSHNAAAAAVAQGRADWGVAIQSAATQYGLAFEPIQEEQYDFVIPGSRRDRPAVRCFVEELASLETRVALAALGLRPSPADREP